MKKIIASLFAALILTFLFVSAINAQTGNSKNGGKNQKSEQQNKKLKIKSKPIPRMSDCQQDSGIVTVLVTFDKSAKVTNVEITRSSGCLGFDQDSIEAARRIKFEPEVKEGEPITVKRPVQYSFRKY